LDAGCDIIKANTFGVNPFKMEGTGYTCEELTEKGIALAKRAIAKAGRKAYAALDIGSLGKLLEPLGDLTFEEAYEANKEAFDANPSAKTLDMNKVTDAYKAIYEEHGGNMHLDGAYSTNGTGHTVFGQVFEGMDNVYALSEAATDGNDKPVEDMVIDKVEILEYQG